MKRLLIVEDDAVSAKLMLHILKGQGSCDLAVDGEQAIDLFKKGHADGLPYDAMLLDLMLPQKSGYEVLVAIRAFESKNKISPTNGIKVVVTSALGDEESILNAHITGCNGYLVKPLVKGRVTELLGELGIDCSLPDAAATIDQKGKVL